MLLLTSVLASKKFQNRSKYSSLVADRLETWLLPQNSLKLPHVTDQDILKHEKLNKTYEKNNECCQGVAMCLNTSQWSQIALMGEE
jgi:hypothetical protein